MTPPRRLDALTRLQQQLPPIRVWLNGIEQHRVTRYDCDAGTLERVEIAPDGKSVRVRDEWSIETVCGEVTVAFGETE